MTLRLQDKTILITGAARRVGAETARVLHAEGASLALHYRRSAEAAKALVAELNAARPGSALAFQADLLDIEHLPRLVADVVEHFGRLDALVNNASSFYATLVGNIGERDWEDLIGTNLAGLSGLTRALALELGPHVRVNAVAPGPILWPEDGSFDAAAQAHVVSRTLLKRCGDPADIARTVLCLIADAPFITGQIVAVDGGRSVML